MNKLEETIKVASYAEKELELILSEVELQSERLVNIQKKSGVSRIKLYECEKALGNVIKLSKVKIMFIILFFVLIVSVLVFFKLKV